MLTPCSASSGAGVDATVSPRTHAAPDCLPKAPQPWRPVPCVPGAAPQLQHQLGAPALRRWTSCNWLLRPISTVPQVVETMRGGEVRLAVVPPALGYGARGARLQLPPPPQQQQGQQQGQGGEGGGAGRGGRAGTVSIPGNAKLYYQVRSRVLFALRGCGRPEGHCARNRVAGQTPVSGRGRRSAQHHRTAPWIPARGTGHVSGVRRGPRAHVACALLRLLVFPCRPPVRAMGPHKHNPGCLSFLSAPTPPQVNNLLGRRAHTLTPFQPSHPHSLTPCAPPPRSPGRCRRSRCFAARAWRGGWPAAPTTRTHAYERRWQGSSRSSRGEGKGRSSRGDGERQLRLLAARERNIGIRGGQKLLGL